MLVENLLADNRTSRCLCSPTSPEPMNNVVDDSSSVQSPAYSIASTLVEGSGVASRQRLKARVSKSIMKLRARDIGSVIQMALGPEAAATPGEHEIDLDSLEDKKLNDLEQYCTQCLAHAKHARMKVRFEWKLASWDERKHVLDWAIALEEARIEQLREALHPARAAAKEAEDSDSEDQMSS